MKKRALSLFLALALCLGLLPLTAAAATMDVPSTATWTATTAGGQTIDQDTYSDKIQILVFFQVTELENGTHCRISLDTIQRLWIWESLVASGKVQVVALGVPSGNGYDNTANAQDLRDFMNQLGLKEKDGFTLAWMNKNRTLYNYAQEAGISVDSFCANYVVDPQRHIRAAWCGDFAPEQYRDALKELGVTVPSEIASGYCGAEGNGENLSWALTGDDILTISGKGEMKDYESFGSAPWKNLPMKAIVIQEGVTTIGAGAFEGCRSATSVTIPASVTAIGDGAFLSDYLGTRNGVERFIVAAENPAYTEEDGVLFNKDKSTLVQYPLGNMQDTYAIPDGVTTIGDSAFSDCYLDSVTFPKSVTTIGVKAFYDCYSLDSVTFAEGLTTIGDGAFDACYNLISAALPKSVTTIGDHAFRNCDVTSVTLPEGLTTINVGAFEGCDVLTDVTFPEGLTTICDNAFDKCIALTGVTLPESLTTIGNHAFDNTALTDVAIPANVTAIGRWAFGGAALAKFTVAADNPAYAAEDGVLFNKEKTTLICYPRGNAQTAYKVPDGVTTIGAYSFAAIDHLTSMTIPKSVTTIADMSFQYCYALTEVKFMGNAPEVCSPNAYSMASNGIELLDLPSSGIFIGDTLTAYYPQGNSTWTEGTRAKLGENADVTWVPFDAGPSEPETYTVTVWSAQHGKVTASPTSGKAGTKVTLTITPDKGYELDTLVVKQSNGTAVKVTNNTFTMPAADVTVTPTFKELPPETYTVTVANAQHGKVTASPVKGTAGTKVKLTITPDKDYELDALTVKQANGTAVKVTDNAFTMPASNVTVTATFKALPVDRLSLNRSSVSVSVGSSVAVSATVSGYAGKHVYAISSDASVATVSVSDKTVRVKGVAQGSASVYVVMADTTAMTLGQAKADPSMKELKVTVTKAGTSGGGGSTGGGGSSGGGGGASGGSSGGSTSTTPTTPEPTTPASQTFGDVEKGSWYESGVTFVTEKGLFNGVGDGAFAPQQNMTRAMLMTVLARLDGQSTDGGATWYSKGMDWAKAQGISDGTAPEGNITREQLVTMLYRYAQSPAATGGLDDFADASAISDWAQAAMRWAVANGILTGKGDARLDPQGLATRAEVATILQRYVEKLGQ